MSNRRHVGEVHTQFIISIIVIMPSSYKQADLFHLPSTNPRIEKFINFIMQDGKKTIARKLFDSTLAEIKASGHENALLVWETAIENASPNVMVKSKRVG